MTQKKFPGLLAMSLLVFLFFSQGIKADLQTPVEFQIRNNETSGLNFGIKLFGGLGRLVGQNDVNTALESWNNLMDRASNYFGYNVSGKITPLKFGPLFGGELLLSFNAHFAIGLGVGYLQFTNQSTKTLIVEGEQMNYNFETIINSIPLTLSLYYHIPLGNTLKVVIGTGAGYYLSKYDGTMGESNQYGSMTERFETKTNTFGAHGILNFELNIGRSLALIFDASGRFAVLKDLIGTQSISYSDSLGDDFYSYPNRTLWYTEEKDFNNQYHVILFGDEVKPNDSWYRNVRKAEISLSSITLQIGILIKLSQLFK